MTKTSFSSFLVEGVDPKHPGLEKKLEGVRGIRGNESVADHEIAILRIGDTTDAALLGAYLDWMGENLRITDAPKNLLLRQRAHAAGALAQ